MYLLRGINNRKKFDKGSFKYGKHMFNAWDSTQDTQVEVMSRLFEKYVFRPITNLLSSEYAELKLMIQERNATRTDFDAHKYKLNELQKKDKLDTEKIKVSGGPHVVQSI